MRPMGWERQWQEETACGLWAQKGVRKAQKRAQRGFGLTHTGKTLMGACTALYTEAHVGTAHCV